MILDEGSDPADRCHTSPDSAPPDSAPPDSAPPWPGTERVASERFTDARQLLAERRLTRTADDQVGHLSTVSAYPELGEPIHAFVLERIRAASPATVDVVADLTVVLARLS